MTTTQTAIDLHRVVDLVIDQGPDFQAMSNIEQDADRYLCEGFITPPEHENLVTRLREHEARLYEGMTICPICDERWDEGRGHDWCREDAEELGIDVPDPL